MARATAGSGGAGRKDLLKEAEAGGSGVRGQPGLHIFFSPLPQLFFPGRRPLYSNLNMKTNPRPHTGSNIPLTAAILSPIFLPLRPPQPAPAPSSHQPSSLSATSAVYKLLPAQNCTGRTLLSSLHTPDSIPSLQSVSSALPTLWLHFASAARAKQQAVVAQTRNDRSKSSGFCLCRVLADIRGTEL